MNKHKEIMKLIMKADNKNMNDGINVCREYNYNRKVIHQLYFIYLDNIVNDESDLSTVEYILNNLTYTF